MKLVSSILSWNIVGIPVCMKGLRWKYVRMDNIINRFLDFKLNTNHIYSTILYFNKN